MRLMSQMITVTQTESQIRACWLGKNIGGTLGGPHEGKSGPLELTFYDPVPDGVLPNDDLDLQLVWLHHLRHTGARTVTPELLAQAWEKHVRFPYDEYGYGLRNAALGITGSARGAMDNWFGEGMGAAIRSELWACICAGDPARAAGFAWADAVNDHCGEGVWAEVFLAALQAIAFGGGEKEALILQALNYVPEDSLIRQAVLHCLNSWQEGSDWLSLRNALVERYYNGNFTHVVINIAFTILGWLAGKGDFAHSICIAVNCGMDTDCTGATLGALMGIHDPNCIPDAWLVPIGEAIVVSPEIVGIKPPLDIDDLVSQTLALKEQLTDAQPQLGLVAACRPLLENTAFAIPCRFSPISAEAFAANTSPAMTQSKDHPLPGHWFHLNGEFDGGDYLALSFELKYEGERPLEVMTYADTETSVWVDGQRLNHFTTEEATRNPYFSASPHRAGAYRTELPASHATSRRLTVAYRRKHNGEPVDAVVAVADAKSHLWIPDALARKH